jgi:hypothetical protein
MPFKSVAQRAFLAINNPKVAKRFAAETPKGAPLPEHVAKKVPKGGKFVPLQKGMR